MLVEALVARGFKVFTINPKQSERFRDRFSVAGAKDDRFDARVLASALRTDFDLFRAVEPESGQQIRLRTATRMAQTIKEQSREVANRLRDLVMSFMPLLSCSPLVPTQRRASPTRSSKSYASVIEVGG